MSSPIKLRNRITRSESESESEASDSSCEVDLTSPSRSSAKTKTGTGLENSGNLTGRPTRKSMRHLQQTEKVSNVTSAADAKNEGGGRGSVSPSSTGRDSNAENINITARENNENTPQRKLTRNRSVRKPSFTSESNINEEEKSVKCFIRRQPVESTPKTRNLPRRKSTTRISCLDYDDRLTDSEDEDVCRKTRSRNNRSYFTKRDNEDFIPETNEDSEMSSEEETEVPSEQDAEDSSDNEEEELDEATPSKRPLLGNELNKLASTPDIMHKLGHSVRRQAFINSPVATTSQTMSPNPENYFLAETRIKFKVNSKKEEVVMNDAMKGKRRRKKPTMDSNSRLPEKIPTDFSVTLEANKATVNAEDFVSGNLHEEQVERIFKNIVEIEFPHWLGLFRHGFNVMMYGYGSKLSVFKDFEKLVNNHYLTVTVNGLFPKLNPRKFLHGIFDYINPPDAHFPHSTNFEAMTREVASILLNADSQSDVFILVNNFDTMALRFPQMLSVLCSLAEVPYIHILASCDTVNAFLGVTQSQSLQLNFCWMHCPTYKAYKDELKWIPGIYGDETRTITQKSSLKYVLQSLTGNARKAFALLANMQLKQMKSRAVEKSKETYAGVRFQELAKECREKFIAHSDENLRTLLVEFFDHKLIKQSGKGKHLETTLLIELDVETLSEIISDLD